MSENLVNPNRSGQVYPYVTFTLIQRSIKQHDCALCEVIISFLWSSVDMIAHVQTCVPPLTLPGLCPASAGPGRCRPELVGMGHMLHVSEAIWTSTSTACCCSITSPPPPAFLFSLGPVLLILSPSSFMSFLLFLLVSSFPPYISESFHDMTAISTHVSRSTENTEDTAWRERNVKSKD